MVWSKTSDMCNLVAQVSYARGKRAVDSKRWRQEVPATMGLYHAMVSWYQKDCRQHKISIGVSGGCAKCSDKFYNLMLDVEECTG
jgi:hypothetical protein